MNIKINVDFLFYFILFLFIYLFIFFIFIFIFFIFFLGGGDWREINMTYFGWKSALHFSIILCKHLGPD